jgi:hypothetical protein
LYYGVVRREVSGMLWLRRVSMMAVVLCLAGCWVPQGEYAFLTADPSGGGLRDIIFGPTAEDDAAEDGGEGGGEEREQVEPDVIRQAGDLLYVLNQHRGLSIVDLETEELLSQTSTTGYPRDLYLVGDRAYVLVGYAGEVVLTEDTQAFDVSSRLYVLDVSDPEDVGILGSYDLAGDLVDSRIVGDVLYAVSAEFQYVYFGEEVAKQQMSSSWIASVNLEDPDDIHVVDTLDFGGYGDVIHTTPYAVFVSSHDWQTDQSTITYIDIDDAGGAIALRGTISVPGRVADRFKMNAWDGVLRVVSATGWPDRQTYVTTVDLSNPDALAVLGQIPVPGTEDETLFATRFDGPRAYLVTYLIVDPLFVIDLSDPANPVVAGELKVPGWSTHIEPMGDTLVALGVDDTDGRKVSVSLFDVSDPSAPGLLDRVSFGEDWSWSSAFSDVKAFTVLDDTLIVPFSGWTESGGVDRLQFVSYDATTLTTRGHVDLEGQIVRSFEYDGNYYGVTTEQLAILDGGNLDALEVTNTVTLAEYVEDFFEMGPDLGVKVISKFDSQTTLLRAVNGDGDALGAVEVAVSNLSQVLRWNDTLLLVHAEWGQTSSIHATPVSFETPAAPVAGDAVKIAMQPYYWGYYGGGPYGVDNVAERDVAVDFWYPMWIPEDTAFVTGDTLTVRGYAEDYDRTVGDEEVRSGVALVDLESMTLTETVGLRLDQVERIAQVGETLYVSSKLSVGMDLLGRPLSAYYVSTFDPATGALGTPANVPGRYVSYNPATGVLVLDDAQYRFQDYETERSLQSVRWTGGTVTRLDEYALSSYGTVHGGEMIFVEDYARGYRLTALTVGDDGALTAIEPLAFGDLWASFLASDGNTAYVNLSGRAVARYNFVTGPELVDVTQVPQTPNRIRFGAETAYGPLGYGGLLRLAR